MHYWTGCSGWQYPEWIDKFYPKDLPKTNWFSFYAEHFNTVEINYSFYHFPTEKTVQRWEEQVSKNFRYSLKANRAITHYHRFHDTQSIINDFYKLSDILGEKLGCILFQLPKTVHYNPDILNAIIEQLSANKLNVLEFRHDSWWREDVIELLTKKKIIFSNVSAPMIQQNFQATGKISYLRFHGEKDWYQGIYGSRELKKWVKAIHEANTKEVWCYFDNTMDGAAIRDALTWKKLIATKE